MTEGVILGNQTLVLQSVELDAAGLYTCVASNTVADGESNALHLDIKCRFILDLQSIGSSPVLTNIKTPNFQNDLTLILIGNRTWNTSLTFRGTWLLPIREVMGC